MKLAIVSDIHDNVWKLASALPRMQPADALICCGDLCSPFIVGLLASGFTQGAIHIVFGNNDGDLYRITQNAAKHAHVHLHGVFYDDTLDGKRIAVNHYPDIARATAASGMYDLVCYGHDHLFALDRLGTTQIINPGTLMGYEPVGKQDVPATFVLLDLQTGQAERIEV